MRTILINDDTEGRPVSTMKCADSLYSGSRWLYNDRNLDSGSAT